MTDAVNRGQKLLGLYRRGVGGESQNAGRLLGAHLKTHDLTLYDLDPGLPVSQDLAALTGWRESAQWMARLGSDPDAVLTQLVDAGDLTPAETERLLGKVDLERLLDARLSGWAYAGGDDPETLRQAGLRVRPDDLLALSGPLAGRLWQAARAQLFRQTHPERLIRTGDALEQAFVLGLVEALTQEAQAATPHAPSFPAPGGEAVEGGVRAHLSAGQLARLRALKAEHGEDLQAVARQAARAYGRSLR